MAYDKVVDSAFLDAGLRLIADAIRGKNGTTGSLAFPVSMAKAIATIDLSSGGSDKENEIVARSIVEYSNHEITEVGAYAFRSCSSLETVDLPNVTMVGKSSFYENTLLRQINMPLLENAGDYAFYYGRALESVYFPRLTHAGAYCFTGCWGIQSVNFPMLSNIPPRFLRECSQLTIADFGLAGEIGEFAFYYCESLTTLILRSESVCSLYAATVFNGTPFYKEGAGGKVYVPNDLISEYQEADEWNTLWSEYGTCEFCPIEGSIYEYLSIPHMIGVGYSFAYEECGRVDDKIYKSLVGNNVQTPEQNPDQWELVE